MHPPVSGSNSRIFHRHLKKDYLTAVKGDGVYVIDNNGRRVMDACSGAAVSCLGHSHPKVIEAIIQQVQQLPFIHSSVFTTDVAEALADRLVASAPGDLLSRVYLVSGGSEAVETALKMARQYFLESGQETRRFVIARNQSYHGNTLGALSAGGNRWRRKTYEPMLIEMSHISACYEYRDRREGETREAYGLRVANELETEILRLGAENVLAFVAEPVVGATIGCVPAVPGYFKRIREICDRYGVLLILDEVMCGMGRTGSLYAYEQEDVVPDLITIAKGLGAGYQPIGAVLLRETIFQAMLKGTGFFHHGHTYMAHATACAAALAVQNVIAEEGLLANVQARATQLEQGLRAALSDHPHVGDIRGRGLFFGVELVADKNTKAPFAPSLAMHEKVRVRALEHNVMCYAMGGTIDGQNGNHVMLMPPYISSASEIDFAVDALARAVGEATR